MALKPKSVEIPPPDPATANGAITMQREGGTVTVVAAYVPEQGDTIYDRYTPDEVAKFPEEVLAAMRVLQGYIFAVSPPRMGFENG